MPFLRPLLRRSIHRLANTRCVTTSASSTSTGKKEGDISSVFVSLSGTATQPLPQRFAELKTRLISGHVEAVHASWIRLLSALHTEIPLIASLGTRAIPDIEFGDLDHASEAFKQEHRARGVAVIRNVVSVQEALGYKEDVKRYIAANPRTKAFPPGSPQVFELYWSPSQLRARAHPNVLKAQRFLMSFWRSKDRRALVSTQHPTSYADRLRIRQPGDNLFALGPHIDGGSVERWEESGYGLGHVYDSIFHGDWESYDPFESSCRLPVASDLYEGAGACTMFRMYQGWLSMSDTAPREGTLLVNPLFRLATAYYLLRPFFAAKKGLIGGKVEEYLAPENWALNPTQSSALHGAHPGHCQELSAAFHPHLDLEKSMTHIPRVRPGDYVAWHCDTAHSVDSVHTGSSDSSVLYIPACPLTEGNATYLAKQRDAFVAGVPAPDFPGGEGEKGFVGRMGPGECVEWMAEDGRRAFGLEGWKSEGEVLEPAERVCLDRANKVLGFYD